MMQAVDRRGNVRCAHGSADQCIRGRDARVINKIDEPDGLEDR